MTTSEFSNAFDTLLSSYNTRADFGEGASKREIVLDEYEKSVFLTQAQDIVIKSYFDSSTNSQGQGIDDSTRRQVDFSSLITVASPSKLEAVATTAEEGESSGEGTEPPTTQPTLMSFDDRGVLYKLPSNILIMLNEKVKSGNRNYVVVPINYAEYDRLMSKAYGQPLKKQCWRLFQNVSGIDITSEIIPTEGVTVSDYRIRYIRRPRPIILTNLSLEHQESLEIDGISAVTECELNPIVHMDILNKAVELALASKGGGLDLSN